MTHLVIIGIFALVCVLWVVLTRALGGDCSRCTGCCGKCEDSSDDSAVSERETESSYESVEH